MKYINVIDFWDENLVRISFDLRKMLPDYVDCVIVATAIRYSDMLLTEDSRIHAIKEYIHKNYGVRVLSYSELSKMYKSH